MVWEIDVQPIVIHELGHLLGLYHWTGALSESQMANYYEPDYHKRRLYCTDVYAFCDAYLRTDCNCTAVGFEDEYVIYEGPEIISGGSQVVYTIRFYDTEPTGDYIVDRNFSIGLEHSDGWYELAGEDDGVWGLII